MSSPAVPTAAVTVLLVDVDEALASLYGEWLADRGWHAVHDGTDATVTVLDIPYPRQAEKRIREVSQACPGAPIVAIVPTCHPLVSCCGSAARALGVTAMVAAPVRRETLLAAIDDALKPRP